MIAWSSPKRPRVLCDEPARAHLGWACAVVVACALALSGCGDRFEWNQKVTLIVDTPDGKKTGSSVVHVEWWEGIPYFYGPAGGGGYRLFGEAPFVDLGHGRYLFALLDGMEGLAHKVLSGGRGPMVDVWPKIEGSTDIIVLPEQLYPMLITFDDIKDPLSIREVTAENISEIFGSSVILQSITITITDEAPTTGRLKAILSDKFFRHWAAIQRAALKDGGFRNSYFVTTPSKYNRNNFARK